jgi:hypothetical protein
MKRTGIGMMISAASLMLLLFPGSLHADAAEKAAKTVKALETEMSAGGAILPSPAANVRVMRFAANPIIRPDMLPNAVRSVKDEV